MFWTKICQEATLKDLETEMKKLYKPNNCHMYSAHLKHENSS